MIGIAVSETGEGEEFKTPAVLALFSFDCSWNLSTYGINLCAIVGTKIVDNFLPYIFQQERIDYSLLFLNFWTALMGSLVPKQQKSIILWR